LRLCRTFFPVTDAEQPEPSSPPAPERSGTWGTAVRQVRRFAFPADVRTRPTGGRRNDGVTTWYDSL